MYLWTINNSTRQNGPTNTQCVVVNSSPTSVAYMRRWTGSAFVHITAPRHNLNQCWVIVNWTTKTNISEILIKINKNLCIHENESGSIVCETADIYSRGRWVNVKIRVVFFNDKLTKNQTFVTFISGSLCIKSVVRYALLYWWCIVEVIQLATTQCTNLRVIEKAHWWRNMTYNPTGFPTMLLAFVFNLVSLFSTTTYHWVYREGNVV